MNKYKLKVISIILGILIVSTSIYFGYMNYLSRQLGNGLIEVANGMKDVSDDWEKNKINPLDSALEKMEDWSNNRDTTTSNN